MKGSKARWSAQPQPNIPPEHGAVVKPRKTFVTSTVGTVQPYLLGPPSPLGGGQTGPRLRSDRIVSATYPSSPPTTGGADYRGMPHPYYLSWHPKKIL